MAVDLVATDSEPRAPARPARRSTARWRWAIAVVAGLLFAGALGYLTGNQVQANSQFDRTHTSLDVTRHHTAVVLGTLASVRHELTAVNGQVEADQVALTRDTNQLASVRTALTGAQVNVDRQTRTIGDLQTCLSGVEQALNALAVGDQARAIAALNGVTASCTAAVDAGG